MASNLVILDKVKATAHLESIVALSGAYNGYCYELSARNSNGTYTVVVPSAVTQDPDGTYSITFPAQLSADVIRVSLTAPDVTGKGFEGANTVDVTIP